MRNWRRKKEVSSDRRKRRRGRRREEEPKDAAAPGQPKRSRRTQAKRTKEERRGLRARNLKERVEGGKEGRRAGREREGAAGSNHRILVLLAERMRQNSKTRAEMTK
jgi:hypothetical protein